MSVQIGAHYLERHNGGRGVLLGGAPGVRPARVVVLGAGNVGWNAAWMAAGLEAEVDLLDKNVDRLRYVDQIQMGRITTLASNRGTVERVVAEADLVIGAVLVPGGRAPVVVTDEMVASMKPGSVVVDIAIDQGGCIETSHETTHDDPVYERHGVMHYAVGNMPGAVPNTSTYALTNVTLPYLAELARLGVAEARAGRRPARARRQHRRRAGGERGGGRGAGPAVTPSWATIMDGPRVGERRRPARRSSTTSTRRSSASCSSTGACPTPSSARRSACRRRPCASGCSASSRTA